MTTTSSNLSTRRPGVARFHIRRPKLAPRASWQGPIGAALVTGGVWWLTLPAWGLVVAGGFLLLAAAMGA